MWIGRAGFSGRNVLIAHLDISHFTRPMQWLSIVFLSINVYDRLLLLQECGFTCGLAPMTLMTLVFDGK